MGDINVRLPSGGGLTINFSAADKLIEKGSGAAALLYIYILRNGSASRVEAAKKLGIRVNDIDAALLELEELGLVELPEPTVEKPSPAQSDPAFKMLVGEVQRRLGKVLSSAELVTLLGLYSDQRMPAEVISLLVTYSVDEVRNSGDRGPTMRQIEKTAFAWLEKGVDNLESATELLKNADRKRGDVATVRQALGITAHAMTATEAKYIDSWLDMGYGPELIAEAYDRTVIATGKLTWKYMDTIITRWHKDGLSTAEQIEQDKRAREASAARKKADVKSEALTDEEVEKEKRRMQKLLEIINGEEKDGV